VPVETRQPRGAPRILATGDGSELRPEPWMRCNLRNGYGRRGAIFSGGDSRRLAPKVLRAARRAQVEGPPRRLQRWEVAVDPLPPRGAAGTRGQRPPTTSPSAAQGSRPVGASRHRRVRCDRPEGSRTPVRTDVAGQRGHRRHGRWPRLRESPDTPQRSGAPCLALDDLSAPCRALLRERAHVPRRERSPRDRNSYGPVRTCPRDRSRPCVRPRAARPRGSRGAAGAGSLSEGRTAADPRRADTRARHRSSRCSEGRWCASGRPRRARWRLSTEALRWSADRSPPPVT
jgi:hypothetical protein